MHESDSDIGSHRKPHSSIWCEADCVGYTSSQLMASSQACNLEDGMPWTGFPKSAPDVHNLSSLKFARQLPGPPKIESHDPKPFYRSQAGHCFVMLASKGSLLVRRHLMNTSLSRASKALGLRM